MSLLARAKAFARERDNCDEQKLEVLRVEVVRFGTFSSPAEKLEKIEWPWALKAARLLLLQCGKFPDSDTLDAVAALLLYLSGPAEKVEKVEKPEVHYGLTRAEARALLTRVCLGRCIRLADDGRIEMVDG